MKQLEIQYFFPLTEQINLDLDYSISDEYKKLIEDKVYSTGSTVFAFTSNTNTSNAIHIHVPLTFISEYKPNIVKRCLYKLLGINWKTK